MKDKRAHTSVEVSELPQCDFCQKQASYDGKTVFGPWASMCEAHFKANGVGVGLGKGQKLILKKEPTLEVNLVNGIPMVQVK